MAQFFGAPLRRFEDPRLLRGEAAFVRSPHGHARLGRLDFSVARAVPGVVAVLGPTELGANPAIPVVIPQADLRECQQRALAEERVRYVGEPIGIVLAEDRYAAEDGAA